MKHKVSKIVKIIAITCLSLIALLAMTIGIIFQFVLTPETITPKVVQAINKNLNAELEIDAIELTFFKTFPNFKLELQNGIILNPQNSIQDSIFSPNDTLMRFDYGVVSVNPLAFIGNSIEVNKFSFENPAIYAFISPDGEVNWDILKKNGQKEKDSLPQLEEDKKEFKASINIEEVSIINGNLTVDDRYSDNYLTIQGFDMNMAAKYSDKEVLLKLDSQSDNVIARKKGNTYTDELSVVLNTDFYVNRKTKVIDLKNAKVGINDIVFIADGKLRPNREEKQIGVDLHLDLEVPKMNTLIDLIPETIFEKTDDYQAKGDVTIVADINGIYKKGKIPAINAFLQINEGEISYKNLPHKIELIEVDMEAYISPQIRTGSKFDIRNFTLKGVGTEIKLTGKGRDLFDNSDIELKADGKLDLEALENSLPFKKSLDLKGSGNIHLRANFNINDVKNQDFGKVQALGTLDMNKIVYHNESDSLKIAVEKASLQIGQDQNSTLLTSTSSKVTGGKILVQNLEFTDGKKSSGKLDQLAMKFAATPIRDTTKVAVMKSSILIENGDLNLGDSLTAKIQFVDAKVNLQPSEDNLKIPSIYSELKIDSTGINSKGRFFAITKGNYTLSATKVGKKWPIKGAIFFDQLYAYTPTFPLLLKMPKTQFSFKPGVISMDHAKIEVGSSDIEASGKLYEFGDAFFDGKMLKGELEVNSSMLDINELIQAMNQGEKPVEKTAEEIMAEDTNFDAPTTNEQPKSFVVPKRLDLSLTSNFDKVKYKRFNIDDLEGIITVKDQKIDLANLQMTTMAAQMSTSITYESKIKGIAALDFDFKLNDIDLSKLTELMPVLDTILPMADSFEGKVNFRMKGDTKVDSNLGMTASSLDAIARVEGDHLVILSGKTFEKMAKMLFFKNKEKNTIDRLEFAMIFKNQQIEIFPSVVTVDRYKVAIGGNHNLDLTYNYHVSILKSPMPFKAGLDLKGTEEDMDFKITKAKYKHLFSTKERQRKKADSTLIIRKNNIIKSLPFDNQGEPDIGN